MAKLTRTEMKHKAQELIMVQIANARGYWPDMLESVGEEIPEVNFDDFCRILKREADRVAKLFGYEESWSN